MLGSAGKVDTGSGMIRFSLFEVEVLRGGGEVRGRAGLVLDLVIGVFKNGCSSRSVQEDRSS